jgi:hypothetical protein
MRCQSIRRRAPKLRCFQIWPSSESNRYPECIIDIVSLNLKIRDTRPIAGRARRWIRTWFNLCPESLRTPNPNATEQLRCSLLALNQPCAFLHILVPDVKKVWHYHSRYLQSASLVNISKEPNTTPAYASRVQEIDTIGTIKDTLRVSSSDRCCIEEDTRQQSSSKQWFLVRARRITSSISGRILIQHRSRHIYQCLYPKPMFDPLPAAIAWGRQNESVACRIYQEYMIEQGHIGLTTHPCGFIIHPTKGWLGASPDARVIDPSCNLIGIAEFKCPCTKRDSHLMNMYRCCILWWACWWPVSLETPTSLLPSSAALVVREQWYVQLLWFLRVHPSRCSSGTDTPIHRMGDKMYARIGRLFWQVHATRNS